jgi:hypothetical protein
MPFAPFVLDVDDEFFAFLANEGYTLQPLAERLPDFPMKTPHKTRQPNPHSLKKASSTR